MRNWLHRKRFTYRVVLTLLACSGLLGAGAAPELCGAEDVRPPATRNLPGDKPAAASGAAGMRAYIDPQTGELVGPPTGGTTGAPRAADAVSASAEGVVEVPGTTPAGGVMVDLKGRFRSAIVSTVDGANKTSTQCLSNAPANPGQE